MSNLYTNTSACRRDNFVADTWYNVDDDRRYKWIQLVSCIRCKRDIISYPLHLASRWVFPWNSREKFGPHKTRIMGLLGSENAVWRSIGWAVSTQYQRVTDRRTDRRPTYIITCAVWLTHVNDACFCWCWHTIPHFAASFHPESNTLTRFKQTNLVTRQTVSCSNCNRYRMYDVRAPLIVHAIRLTTVSDPPDSNPDVTYLYLHPAGAHVRCKLDAA